MRIIKILLLTQICLGLFLLTPISVKAAETPISGATGSTAVSCPAGQIHPKDPATKEVQNDRCAPVKRPVDCASGQLVPGDATRCVAVGDACIDKSEQDCIRNNAIIKDINIIVNVLSGLVGVLIVIMIIVGGIQYSIAGDNASAVTEAKSRITNALIALVAFLLTFAFLQWLIPGGVF